MVGMTHKINSAVVAKFIVARNSNLRLHPVVSCNPTSPPHLLPKNTKKNHKEIKASTQYCLQCSANLHGAIAHRIKMAVETRFIVTHPQFAPPPSLWHKNLLPRRWVHLETDDTGTLYNSQTTTQFLLHRRKREGGGIIIFEMWIVQET